jgi:peptidoglycan-associated lipoprotein
MNGGNAQAAIHVYRGFSAIADLTGEQTSSVNNGVHGLSLVSFTAGPRFSYLFRRGLAPFAQSLFGGVHGFDSYFPVSSASTRSANGFAMIAGGGLDIRISRRLAIRPIEADYVLMHLPNGVNNAESNLRLSAGFVIRIR